MEEHMRDAAYAANIPASWTGAVGGYLNAKGDPYHPWTPADWARFPHNRKLPIFVQSHPEAADAVSDGFKVLRSLYELSVPRGCRTALDLETAVDPGYVRAYGRVLNYFGYRVWPYGSVSTLFGNPPLQGYWMADYRADRSPFMYDHIDGRATQYTDNPPADKYDSSTIHPWAYADLAHWWR